MTQTDLHTLNRLLAEAEAEQEKENMKLTEMYPSSLLKSQDVTDAGGEMPLVIQSVEMTTFENNGAKETKPIIIFANDKRMVCNKTNANILASMFGDDTDKWLNKEVTLIVQNVDFQGKQVPGLRVKNISSHDAEVQAYWTRSREVGMPREDGLKHLAQFKNDYVAALKDIA